METMFLAANAFNQDLSGWNVNPNVTNCNGFAAGTSAFTLPQPSFGNCSP